MEKKISYENLSFKQKFHLVAKNQVIINELKKPYLSIKEMIEISIKDLENIQNLIDPNKEIVMYITKEEKKYQNQKKK